MEAPEKFSWLDEYLTALEKSIGFMDLSTLQPTSWKHFQPLIAKEWLDWFWTIIEEREKKHVPFTEIARHLEPDLCREHLLFTLEDLKSARWPREKRLTVADFFYQTLKAQMPQGDLFGLYGSTRRHSEQDIEGIMTQEFVEGTPELAREFGKLYNAAYNLGASLYLDFYMGKAIENWGPYELPDGKMMVIKEMRNLRPLEIWPEILTKTNKVNLYAVYEGVTFSTDLIACHTQYAGDVIQGLKKWRLEVEGSAVRDKEKIREVALNLAEAGKSQWQSLMQMPEQELLEKAVRIRCYCFKEVCDLLGLDWRPTPALLEAPKGKTLAQGWQTWNQPAEEQAYNKYWRKIWDPREEFYPEMDVHKA
jgi:hypothetical protein